MRLNDSTNLRDKFICAAISFKQLVINNSFDFENLYEYSIRIKPGGLDSGSPDTSV